MFSRAIAPGCLVVLMALAPAAALADPPAQGAPAPAAPTPTPAPAPAAPVKAAPAAPAAAKTAAKAAPAKKKKKKKDVDAPVTGPIATYPGFRMLDGGGSRVFVTLSKKLAVTEHKAEGKLTYRIQGARVPTANNRRALITTFFSTPVSRAELVERDGDVDLVIEVRSAGAPQFRIVENDKGAELQVDFPKVATATTEDAAVEPAAAVRPAATKNIDDKSASAY